jgi:putative hydrolase of the HAD superfamily
MNIKAVVFDYGKVISFPPDPAVMDELAALGGVRREDMEPLLWKLRGEYDRGAVSAAEYYRGLLSRLGAQVDDCMIEKMVEIDLLSWKQINPGTVKLMEAVKGHKLKLGILSNMPFDFLAWARKTLPVFSLPDVGIFSCEAASIKPEEGIYRKLFDALACGPGEIVFFDDTPVNVEKARKLKMRAFLWKDPETAREELARLEVKL